MLGLAALSSLLAVAPLQVRVLERERPSSLTLSGTLTCDGRPLAAPVEVTPGIRELVAGAEHCADVSATGDIVVTVKGEAHRYPGTVRVSLEGGSLRLINEVDVEAYLPAVVEAEAGSLKPAALEAQAVVSRTFALASRRRHATAGYDLCDLAHCQVYRGRTSSEAARAAVTKSKNQVLLSGSVALKPAFFHAACGGHTSSAQDVFGEDSGGPGVSDAERGVARCHDAPDFAWGFSVDRVKVAQALGGKEDGPVIEVLRRDVGGRVLELKLFGRRLTGDEFLSRFGHAFGWQAVRSAKFQAEEVEGVLRVTGTGTGHGVGLCQAGAQALAEKGVDGKGILARYFPDARVADVSTATR
jgi:stage II sporulation protein D